VDEFKTIAPEFEADVKEVFDFTQSVQSREVIGGTGPQAVRQQIAHATNLLG
jgi:argininosuccinate lyase